MKTLKSILILGILLTTSHIMGQELSVADVLREDATKPDQHMYVIERNISDAGNMSAEELTAISKISCSVLNEMGPQIKWLHSYITGDKIYCVYMANNEELVREHAKKGGFPADSVSKVVTVIDPSTAGEM